MANQRSTPAIPSASASNLTNPSPESATNQEPVRITSEPAPVFAADVPLESIPLQALERRKLAQPIKDDRRASTTDRRASVERRVLDIGSPTGLERRRGPGRRLSDDRKSAEEGHMSDEQFEFVLAVDTYKRLNNRPFPSWTEILEIVKQLGYRKVAGSTVQLSAATPRAAATAPNPGPVAPPDASRPDATEFFHG